MKNVADIYPLTPTQAGILFHTLQAPGSGVYVEQYVCTLSGRMDVAAFRQAWHTVVNLHPVLRTAFIWEGIDEPLQVVRAAVEFPFVQEDWRELSAAEQSDRLDTFLRQDRFSGFDPAKAPLLRLALFKLETNVHSMVWSFHHLQLDGWSTSLVLKDVFDCYEALHRGDAPKISAPRAFKDYVGWLKQQDIHQAETFWKKELAGFTAPTSLRVERSPTAKELTGRYGQCETKLSEQVTATLRQLAQHHRLTLNTIIQGAWAILLSRYSGERDVLFGATVSGRPADLPGVQSMVGMFINTLPVRMQVEPDVNLLPWLRAIQSRQLELRRYEYSPLSRIQACSDIPKGQSLFETILVFENYPIDGSTFQTGNPSLRVDNVRYLEQSNYPLSVLVVPGRHLQLYVIYNSSYFDDDVVARLLGHLEALLNCIATNANQPVGALTLLTPDEDRQLRDTWNNTRLDYPQPPLIQRFIEQHAAQNPEAVAVVDNAGQLTYRELDLRANQLAHYLLKLGISANTPVGLVLERSTEMIVAILGVLKAGGAYLPLDPAYPQERLAFMLADTQAPVVLAQERLANSLPECEAKTVSIDAEWELIAREDRVAPQIVPVPENLAYVIYTSGSTGNPKGVPVSHANLVHSTSARFHFYEKAVDRFLLLSSFTFDSSMVGIFWTLCQGGRLVLPPQHIEQDMRQLGEIIDAKQISHTLMLPSLYAILLEHADAASLGSLQTVIVAGEECRRELVDLHYTRLPKATLFNEYGPTEGTVWSSAYNIPANFDSIRVPIGRPIPNMQNYILDSHGQLAPIGVPGELCISGAGVTSGYLNRPGLTAQRFVEHSFAGEPPIRLYRTGDLARYLPDGNIEFLGRIDHQVKIRGFRVEMGEIEATLGQHPAVRQAVVVVHGRPHQPDSAPKQLVAYVEPIDGRVGRPNEFRRFLLNKLPDYMVPSAFITLDALPTTPNGKIDRKKLPAPDSDMVAATDTAFVAPRTPVEEKLAAIWATVLGVEAIGIHDNFFELGGDSILSIQIIAKAAQQEIKLKPNDIFQHPSVAALAEVAEVGSPETEAQQTVVTGPVQLTPIQSWFFEQGLSASHHWNQSYLLELAPDADLALIKRSLQQLYLHHDALRLRFSQTGTGWTQENAGTEGSMRVARFDLSGLPETEQQAALAAAATKLQQGLDLASGGLAQAAIFELGPGQSARLLLVIHHLAVDGISWQILLEDLDTAYQQLRRGQPVQLPPKTSSFQHWAERLAAFAQSPDLERDLGFWLAQGSAGDPPLLPEESAGQEHNTAGSTTTISVALTTDETNDLLQRVPAAYQTQVNDALLSALLLTFAEQTGTHSLAFDLEGHGREDLYEDVDLSRTVGWFTTVFPLRLSLLGGADVGKVLISVKEQLRRVPRKGLSYGLLRYLSQDRAVREQLTRLPQTQITFNYMGQFDHRLSGYSLFQAAPESVGMERNPHDKRRYLLDINSMVEQGQLTVKWSYSKNCFGLETVRNLADSFIQNLRAIIEHCTAPGVGGYTPSDFPEANLDQSALDDLLAEFSEVME